jgi:hypothetical protein
LEGPWVLPVAPPFYRNKKFPQKLGGPGIPDDELLLRCMMQEEEIKKMHSMAGPIKEYVTSRNPIVALRKDSSYISIQRKGFSLTLPRELEVCKLSFLKAILA